MALFVVNLSLAILWTLLSGDYTPAALAFGFLVGMVALFLLRTSVPAAGRYFGNIRSWWRLFAVFVVDLVKANIAVLRIVLSGKDIKPAVIAIPMELDSELEQVLLANMITLTPGTLSLDIAEDGSAVYVHVLDTDDVDAVIAETKERFEAAIRRAFS